jgi:hypothetical protein
VGRWLVEVEVDVEVKCNLDLKGSVDRLSDLRVRCGGFRERGPDYSVSALSAAHESPPRQWALAE